jgi:hypothetical protein
MRRLGFGMYFSYLLKLDAHSLYLKVHILSMSKIIKITAINLYFVNWALYHHGMTHSQVADGGDGIQMCT